MKYQEELEFAKELAKEAGEIMRLYFRSDSINREWKDDSTPLTIADTEINRLVINKISEKFPGHEILGEEESNRKNSEYTWVCDPIDGTTPFSHGVPNATFNLALTRDGNSVMSVVYDPFCDRLYTAIKGAGAYLNGDKIEVNHDDDTEKRVPINIEVWAGFSSGMSFFENPIVNSKIIASLSDNRFVPLTFCSVAYSVVNSAEGGIKGVVFGGTNPWDAAACTLVASEAGLVVTDILGNELSRMDKQTRGFLIGTRSVHAEMLQKFLPIFNQFKS